MRGRRCQPTPLVVLLVLLEVLELHLLPLLLLPPSLLLVLVLVLLPLLLPLLLLLLLQPHLLLPHLQPLVVGDGRAHALQGAEHQQAPGRAACSPPPLPASQGAGHRPQPSCCAPAPCC